MRHSPWAVTFERLLEVSISFPTPEEEESLRSFCLIPDAWRTTNSSSSNPLFLEPFLFKRPQSLSSPATDRKKQRARAIKLRIRDQGRAMDYNRLFVLKDPLMSTLHHLMDIPEETEKASNAPTRTYVRDAKAMASTPADVKELPSSYVFVVDMPGVKSGEIKVQVEDDNILIISGERKREEDKEGKYLRMERRMGKFMRRFSLPDNANTDAISAVCQDGVLTVTVPKLPPPEPKKPKTIEVKIA